ncbi:MAG: polyphosphate polymerase domain-containing protein [Candidatus Avispirillum sp.]
MYRSVFKRYELKYLPDKAQAEAVLSAVKEHMMPDCYGRSTVKSIYYDTENFRLIRRSLEKPQYKEKLRLRCYGQAGRDSNVFAELKKKYKGVVYKRRVCLPLAEAEAWICGGVRPRLPTQITEEIDYFLNYYGHLYPAAFISCSREAYVARDKSDLRITFDDSLMCDTENFSLSGAVHGVPLLPEGKILMEIKCSGGMPLWLTDVLTKERIFKTSFSKYGTAYRTLILPKRTKEDLLHAGKVI